MVRHQVENLAEPVRFQLRDKCLVLGRAADLVIELPEIDDIVSVEAAPPRFQVRRGVDVGDAEVREVPVIRRASGNVNSLLSWSRYVETGILGWYSCCLTIGPVLFPP